MKEYISFSLIFDSTRTQECILNWRTIPFLQNRSIEETKAVFVDLLKKINELDKRVRLIENHGYVCFIQTWILFLLLIVVDSLIFVDF